MKCKFIVKNISFKMLVVLSPIFVVDPKITFVCNFVAPLKLFEVVCLHLHLVIALYRWNRNEKLHEIFAYPSNSGAFYGPELNLRVISIGFQSSLYLIEQFRT